MNLKSCFLYVLTLISLCSCSDDETGQDTFDLKQAFMGSTEINLTEPITENLPQDRSITLVFTTPPDEASVLGSISLNADNSNVPVDLTVSGSNILVHPAEVLMSNTVYTLTLSGQLKSIGGRPFQPLSFSFKTQPTDLEILSVVVDGADIGENARIIDVNADMSMSFNFSQSVNIESFEEAFQISPVVALEFTTFNDQKTVQVTSAASLDYLKKYEIEISNTLTGTDNEPFKGYNLTFYTQIDSTYKLPEITDDELLTTVQEQTFKYFWDFAHPVSGLARERNTSGDVVTTGGSGFGVMAILVAIERGFITRQEGVDRLETIVNFLASADRFHGVWPHWMNGNTGEVVPFSQKDNGGDLVETAFMIQGLLTVREYLDDGVAQEADIKATITQLWEEVEWDWYTQGEDVLYWHWSPDYGWDMNHKVAGWNEALIVYVLAASSPTHSIAPEVYHKGWARSGDMQNGNEYYGIELPLGYGKGGPLFFAHYSFLGLDPRNLEDGYANYWTQNVNHTLINRAYSIANPLNYVGYSADSWGLTASDNHQGYSAHSPENDLGVITPTAAISSMPYTPVYSLEAMKHFYYLLGDKLWGPYGFYDAFNLTKEWIANSYLAIDQGPVIIMIENHRSGMLWDLFMANDEINTGLNKLSFTSY